ncbi:putative replication-association protein [mongoose-associated cyclovirus Mon-32]|uniref:Replication-association protein n=1 Tax=mongoose-associated cyclovirus Mon-32 TaxID=3070928 RepID=A0AC61TD95_9CIRC|nr:putative replication-association protein [Mongoose-associated cyclovirus]UBR88851.1 putative replication-association protein [mongoose-associated cyclovirus Mon-32]
MANRTVRRFCFTWNNYDDTAYDKCEKFITKFCKYGIVGEESAPTTGTLHLQGFCNLHKPTRYSTIKKHLDNSIHIEKANGSDEQNQNYCSKSGIFFESGIPNKQGARHDLQSVVESINTDGTTLRDIATKHPETYIRYFRGIQQLLQLVRPVQPRDFKTEVFYYYGPPGSGKSRRALEEARAFNKDSIYYKPRGLWWDGYEQQDSVIIDDFYGWIKYDEMLKIMDRYPYKVQIKGGFQEFTSKKIFITSNVDTSDLYKFIGYDTAAFERRLTNKVHMN